jgi:hypothetical protein
MQGSFSYPHEVERTSRVLSGTYIKLNDMVLSVTACNMKLGEPHRVLSGTLHEVEHGSFSYCNIKLSEPGFFQVPCMK